MSPSRLLFVQQVAFPLELSSQECGPDLSSGGSFPWRKPSVMLVCFDLRPLRSHKTQRLPGHFPLGPVHFPLWGTQRNRLCSWSFSWLSYSLSRWNLLISEQLKMLPLVRHGTLPGPNGDKQACSDTTLCWTVLGSRMLLEVWAS